MPREWYMENLMTEILAQINKIINWIADFLHVKVNED